ncbi:hypothetical protein PHLCEN_2v3824 [Hermanssonia centrifuga]|uniref:Uncharacterized protein n=1 Tax=Hermanssonia centrifuga TaxID=98765 RepID=A0A2R6QBF1_9APHY|nr:hypothetical protein PHLCEN_2v3824 [Hermanssonia centrifuga]
MPTLMATVEFVPPTLEEKASGQQGELEATAQRRLRGSGGLQGFTYVYIFAPSKEASAASTRESYTASGSPAPQSDTATPTPESTPGLEPSCFNIFASGPWVFGGGEIGTPYPNIIWGNKYNKLLSL